MTAVDLHAAFRSHERFLWALLYRMTGVAADADDLVQETFARAVAHPPVRGEPGLRTWLTQVAMNAARDLLRRRRRAPYKGPWLPGPVDAIEGKGDTEEPPAHEPAELSSSPEQRYALVESASFAFLIALEALTPQQRAVLLLRDVFDYSVAEVSDALGLSASNVKVTHHRARARMAAYDRSRETDWTEATERNREALTRLALAMQAQDVAAVEALLAPSARAVTDGGGEFSAAMVPVVGAARVATFLVRLSQLRGMPSAVEARMINGAPALIMEFDVQDSQSSRDAQVRLAPRSVLRIEVSPDGRITEVHSVLASRKLSGVRPIARG